MCFAQVNQSDSRESALFPGFVAIHRRFADLGTIVHLSDFSLAAVLLALRSVLWPYRGLVHDARLYAFQAFNRYRDGEFGQDLFFAYGSQDEYSVFSLLLRPFVAWLGVEEAFWAGYMLSSALFVFAEVRLVRRLIPDRLLADLGLIALTVLDIPYGGCGIFHVHESFLTARLPAQGLALLGLHAALERRWWRAFAFALTGLVVHPLMAIGALVVLLVLVVREAWRALTKRSFLAPVFILGSMIVLWVSVSGGSHFTTMEESWFAAVKNVSWHCFFSKWRLFDWYWLLGSSTLVLASLKWLGEDSRALVGGVVVAGFAGLLVTAAGEVFRVPLLVQGQGYRALWVLELLAVPLGVLVAGRGISTGSPYGRLACLGVVGFLGNPFLLNGGSAMPALFSAGLYLLLSGAWAYFFFRSFPRHPQDAIWKGLFAGLFSVAVIFSALVAYSAFQLEVGETMDPIGLFTISRKTSSPLFWFVLAGLAVRTLQRVFSTPRGMAFLALFVWVTVSCATILVQENSTWRERFQSGFRNLEFISASLGALDHNGKDDRKPQIYWPVDSALIWFHLKLRCYYDFSQMVGILFSRDTAVEGHRRALLAKPFEVARMRKMNLPASSPSLQMHLGFLGASLQEEPPSRADLIRLASDQQLDWIVLNEGFEGLYSATNGSVFIYDCRWIRTSQKEEFMDGLRDS